MLSTRNPAAHAGELAQPAEGVGSVGESDVKLKHPRCPYCHDDVAPGELQAGCPGCRAWHHRACWTEHGKCASCGQVAATHDSSPQQADPAPLSLLVVFVIVAAAVLGLNVAVLPAFESMFREVGVGLPAITAFLLGPCRWLLGMGPLTAVFLAASARDAEARTRWVGVSLGLSVSLLVVYAVVLFVPLGGGLIETL